MKRVTAKNLVIYYNIKAEHALYRKSGDWYHNLTEFPGVLLDKNGFVLFETEESYFSNNKLNINTETNTTTVKNGISNIEAYVNYIDFADKIPIHDYNLKSNSSEKTLRARREIDQLIRNQVFVKEIKELYDYTCQICGLRLDIGNNKHYAEVHHIKPIGRPHNGSDTIDNMICLCPNHHTQLDFGAILIDLDKLKIQKHEIDKRCIDYHNNEIFDRI